MPQIHIQRSIQHINIGSYTKSDKETANVIGQYVNSIGTKSNAGYDQQLPVSREAVRNMDKIWDHKPKIWSGIDEYKLTPEQILKKEEWQQSMNTICQPCTISEIRAAINKCKNRVAYHGIIHILFLKEAQNITIVMYYL